jgi:hypothetical protein
MQQQLSLGVSSSGKDSRSDGGGCNFFRIYVVAFLFPRSHRATACGPLSVQKSLDGRLWDTSGVSIKGKSSAPYDP